jgi:hypothetical protein
MTEPNSPPPIAPAVVDSAGVVVADLPCRQCAYNLKAQPVTGRCPECGAPVGVAVHGELLRYGEPAWLRGLSKGATLAFVGVFAAIFASVAGGFVASFTTPLIAPVAAFAGGLVYVWGAWLLTAPDPSGLGEDKYGRSRQIIRVALLVGALDSIIDAILVAAAPRPDLRLTLQIVSGVVNLVNLVGQFATFWYLRRLVLRIPDPGLAGLARVVFWGYGLSLAAIVLMGGVFAVAGFASGAFRPGSQAPGGGVIGVFAAAGCVMGLAFLGVLGFGIVFLVLLYRLRVAFARQAELAEAIWQFGGPPVPQQLLVPPAP